MKVPETKARLERRKRRVERREALAEHKRLEAEQRLAAAAERRRKWEEGPRIFRIMARGWDAPVSIQFSRAAIHGDLEGIARLPADELKRRTADAEASFAKMQLDQIMADMALDALNKARDRGLVSDDNSD